MSRAEAVAAPGPLAVMGADGRCLAGSVRRADGVVGRFLGLMGRTSLAEGEGLWLEPSSGIHMFFMRCAIDCAFVDKSGRVLRVAHRLRPWRVGWWLLVPGSRATLEVAAGVLQAAGVRPGDRLALVPAPRAALTDLARPPVSQIAPRSAAGVDRPRVDTPVPGGSS